MRTAVRDILSKTAGMLKTLNITAGVALLASLVHAAGVPYQTGDVFAGVAGGKINHLSPTGTLPDTLRNGTTAQDTGMAFDIAGNLYQTAFQANTIFKFNPKGNLLGTFGSGYNVDPESILFDKSGNAYIGQADGTRQILEFSATGAPLGAFAASGTSRGTDWIDLAADQCTTRPRAPPSNDLTSARQSN